jgi:hypothetical protein
VKPWRPYFNKGVCPVQGQAPVQNLHVPQAGPETKGRIENVIGFVKKNFARNRIFNHIDKLNEECRAWLERTGNGKMHNTIKKIPAQVFSEERRHLTPVTEKIGVQKTTVTGSIAVSVRKNNTIVYKSNRYSVPLGTFKDPKSFVYIDLSEADHLKIIDPQTGEVIARHLVCREKGKLIKNNNHGRDRSRKIQELINHFIEEHHDLPELGAFLDGVRSAKPRYIRDQLQLIQSTLQDMDKAVIERALYYCLKNRLYSASDLVMWWVTSDKTPALLLSRFQVRRLRQLTRKTATN